MKLFAVYTREHAVLKDDWFLKTLKDPFELHLKDIGSLGSDRSVFGNEPWLKAVRIRHDYYRHAIEQNQGETIIVCDLDIQFFGRCLPTIERAMEGRDIVFQSENWPFKGRVNSGFVCVRCNPQTLALYSEVGDTAFEKLPIADQTALNALLAEDKDRVRWGIFGNRIWAKSQGSEPPYGVLLHHANCTRGVEDKIEQLRWARDFVRARRRNPYRLAASYLRSRRQERKQQRREQKRQEAGP